MREDNSISNLALCLIIPIYNHSQEFARAFARFKQLKLPTLVIDDGSDEHNRKQLQQLTEGETWITLIRLESNRGKGRAVCEGLRQAASLGYRHALQIDADGQHKIEDVHTFTKAIHQYPNAVITAVRIYKNAPRGRVYGRKITDFWVWVHTLSTQIKDSMCGFRIYPLEQTLNAINLNQVRRGMDFDTDILVKLYWAGVGIHQIPTEVEYDTAICSHFKMWRDNVHISRMHAYLFFGMLLRIPRLLKLRRDTLNIC